MRDDVLATAVAGGDLAALDERRQAMLRYAIKLTATPAQMVRADVEVLRAVGFDDAAILAIAEVTGYYAYVNRIADGLGVQLEGESEAERQAAT